MTTTFKLLAVSLVTAFLTMISQYDNSKMLLGEWKVRQVQAEYPVTMSAAEKVKSSMDLNSWAENFKSNPFIFGKDSTMSVMGKDGKWVLEKDGVHIRFILMENEELRATIVLLKPDSLKFSVLDHEIKEFFTLIKVKK